MSGYLASLGIVLLAFGSCGLVAEKAGSRDQLPLATVQDLAEAPLMIARDGNTITIRGAASDDLRICVEPKAGVFGPVRCYLVRDLRRGAR